MVTTQRFLAQPALGPGNRHLSHLSGIRPGRASRPVSQRLTSEKSRRRSPALFILRTATLVWELSNDLKRLMDCLLFGGTHAQQQLQENPNSYTRFSSRNP